MEKDLEFKGNDPGAVRFGNFINYYQFHPPDTRIKNLPIHLWNSTHENNEHCAILDIGCNSGDLTTALHSFLKQNSNWKRISTLGIDLDKNLIIRAKEKNYDHVTFECIDVMSEDSNDRLDSYLSNIGKNKFDFIFCFSISLWIHLNFGDSGLMKFLDFICEKGNFIVIEPQPWKCYGHAVRRMKKSSAVFPLYSDLKIRSDVESEIENAILKKFDKVYESTSSEWDRKILFFVKKNKQLETIHRI